MTCVPHDPRFRLLDHLVGWDAADRTGLAGLGDGGGIRLAGGPGGVTPAAVDPFIAPPRLAGGCGPCDWYLGSSPAPQSVMKRLVGCSNDWARAWPPQCTPIVFQRIVAVDVDRYRIAVLDAGSERLYLLHLLGGQVLAEAHVDAPRDLALAPDGGVVLVTQDGAALERLSRSGRPLGAWPAPLPGWVARLAFAPDGPLWLATEAGSGLVRLWRAAKDGRFVESTLEDLARAFPRNALVRSDQHGFCLKRGQPDGTERPICWDWFGHPLPGDCVPATATTVYAGQGQLLTGPIDSGIPRCRWHRVRIDADIPAATSVSLAVSTSESPTPADQGVNDARWAGFPAGLPHPDDWQVLPPGQNDALIRQPAGRYLFLRLRLEGDGTASPRVRRIHLDFPRGTSADLLPAVYRDDPAAGDFTERFLSLFDASLETVDETVARFAKLLDAATVPDAVLDWIAGFLSVTLDESWDAETRRRILSHAPDLFRRRGTPEGLRRAIALAFDGTAPAIIEHGQMRTWGAVAGHRDGTPAPARLGSTRLFGPSRSRLTLDRSRIGRTPIKSYGTPAADPHDAGAFRFTVGVPRADGRDIDALRRLVEGQKPAHTLATVRTGSTHGFVLAGAVQLGIDTLLVQPAPKQLGDDTLRLNRGAVLGGRPPPGPILGTAALTSPREPCRETCTE
jgi:phage tail-like protein